MGIIVVVATLGIERSPEEEKVRTKIEVEEAWSGKS
jgi:hypothetical protein